MSVVWPLHAPDGLGDVSCYGTIVLGDPDDVRVVARFPTHALRMYKAMRRRQEGAWFMDVMVSECVKKVAFETGRSTSHLPKFDSNSSEFESLVEKTDASGSRPIDFVVSIARGRVRNADWSVGGGSEDMSASVSAQRAKSAVHAINKMLVGEPGARFGARA